MWMKTTLALRRRREVSEELLMVALTVMEGRSQSNGDGDYDDDDEEEEEEEGNMWALYLLTIHGEGKGLLRKGDKY